MRKRRELTPVVSRVSAIRPSDILLFSTLRNERVRLPYFLKYYREMGINHFLIVDNGSDDGSREYLAPQDDVSLWTTERSYKRARFGADWLNGLQMRYGHGHWTLVVDPDEFFIYPFSDTRPIRALTDWLDAGSIKSFPAMLLDMYPKGPIGAQPYHEGQDPFEIANWFDSGNYTISRNSKFGNLWIQGGPRARMFFADMPERAPALNKVPLVKWQRSYAYASSTHMLLPRGLTWSMTNGAAKRRRAACCTPSFLIPLRSRPTRKCCVISTTPTATNTAPTRPPSTISPICGASGAINTSTGASLKFWG